MNSVFALVSFWIVWDERWKEEIKFGEKWFSNLLTPNAVLRFFVSRLFLITLVLVCSYRPTRCWACWVENILWSTYVCYVVVFVVLRTWFLSQDWFGEWQHLLSLFLFFFLFKIIWNSWIFSFLFSLCLFVSREQSNVETHRMYRLSSSLLAAL